MLKPLFNNVMIELIDEYEGILRDSASDNLPLCAGTLIDHHLIVDHLTASTGYDLQAFIEYDKKLKELVGKVVYYQEYADSGSKIIYEGKKYVMVPFYRLIAFEDAKD